MKSSQVLADIINQSNKAFIERDYPVERSATINGSHIEVSTTESGGRANRKVALHMKTLFKINGNRASKNAVMGLL